MTSRRNMAIPSVEEEQKACWGGLNVNLDDEFYTAQTTDDLMLWSVRLHGIQTMTSAVISVIDGLDENETLKSNVLHAMSAEEAREEAVKEKKKADKARHEVIMVIEARKLSG